MLCIAERASFLIAEAKQCVHMVPSSARVTEHDGVLCSCHGQRASFAKRCTVRIGFDADAGSARSVESVAQDLYEAGAAKVQRWTPAAKA